MPSFLSGQPDSDVIAQIHDFVSELDDDIASDLDPRHRRAGAPSKRIQTRIREQCLCGVPSPGDLCPQEQETIYVPVVYVRKQGLMTDKDDMPLFSATPTDTDHTPQKMKRVGLFMCPLCGDRLPSCNDLVAHHQSVHRTETQDSKSPELYYFGNTGHVKKKAAESFFIATPSLASIAPEAALLR